MRARLALTATLVSVFIFTSYLLLPRGSDSNNPTTSNVSPSLLHGAAIMPHLGNETIKADLGRAAWKLLHTTLGRFPEKPTAEEREALNSYLHLFARLYPCGECAQHFGGVIKKYPPQTSSRDAAAQWGCFVHNVVNERLHKEVFDCGKVTEKYKCGCDEEGGVGKKGGERRNEGEVEGRLERNVRDAAANVEIERGPLNMRGG